MWCCGWGFLSHRIPTCQYCPWLAGSLLLLKKPRSSPLGHGQPTARSRWTRSRGAGRIAGVGGAAAFWIATKDNLIKLKSVVVSLRTADCKLLWLIVSEAAGQPQSWLGTGRSREKAGQAQSLWRRRHGPGAGRVAGTATLFWESMVFHRSFHHSLDTHFWLLLEGRHWNRWPFGPYGFS